MILKTITRDGESTNPPEDRNNNLNFILQNQKGLCQYQNVTSVQKVSNPNMTTMEIKVSNKLCKQNGEYMEKVTQIKFKDEIVTIRDRYRFVNQTQTVIPDQNPHKRIHLFKKPLHSEAKNEEKRRVTKNLPKNFIKSFLNYLESVKQEQNAELLDCKIKLFSSKQKYNNSFIQSIVDDPDLQSYFIDFLNNHAKDWIEKSKIRDKDVHLEAIEVFKKLYLSRNKKKQQNMSLFDSFLFPYSEESQAVSSGMKENSESDKQSIIANSSKHGDSCQQI